MPEFSDRSKETLGSCVDSMQRLFNEVIKHVDCTILSGRRGEEEQNILYWKRLSKKKFPESKHNTLPSLAVDVMAYPVDWEAWERNYMFVGYVLGVAASMGIKVRAGADWDGDGEIEDQTFHDLAHFELIGEREI